MNKSTAERLEEISKEISKLHTRVDQHSEPDDLNEISPVIKDFSAAFELNSRSSNRIWITLAILAVLTVSPQYVVGDPTPMTDLPFSLGKIQTIYYVPFMSIILSLTAIHYCQTQAQAFLIYHHAHEKIDGMGKNREEFRKQFDLLLFPTLSRIFPLVSLGRQTLGWYGAWNPSTKIYYGVIRLVTATVLIGMPMAAIAISFYNSLLPFFSGNILTWIAKFCSILAIFCLLQLLLEEFRHWWSIGKKGAYDS